MKRIGVICLCLLLACTIIGCGGDAEKDKTPKAEVLKEAQLLDGDTLEEFLRFYLTDTKAWKEEHLGNCFTYKDGMIDGIYIDRIVLLDAHYDFEFIVYLEKSDLKGLKDGDSVDFTGRMITYGGNDDKVAFTMKDAYLLKDGEGNDR